MNIAEVVDLIKKGKEKENIFCRVCGRDVIEVKRRHFSEDLIRDKPELEKKRALLKREVEKRLSNSRYGNKDCWDCIHLTAQQCKEIIRVLRIKLEAKR